MIVLQIKKSKEMKKLVLMFVAIAAISFASCGNKTSQTDAAVDSLEATADSVVDSAMVAGDSAAAATVDSAAQAVDSVANAQ